MAVFPEQLLDETGVLRDALFVAVIAIDEDDEVSGLDGHLRALIVAGGSTYTALGIAIDGEPGDVEHPSPDAFIGLTFTAYTECQCVAHELIGIEASDAVAVCDGCKIDEVDEGVDLIEFLALQHAADELLAGWTIARGILAAGFVYTAGGSYTRELFEAVGGQFLTKARASTAAPTKLGQTLLISCETMIFISRLGYAYSGTPGYWDCYRDRVLVQWVG